MQNSMWVKRHLCQKVEVGKTVHVCMEEWQESNNISFFGGSELEGKKQWSVGDIIVHPFCILNFEPSESIVFIWIYCI